ncbi:hypothetical protein JCM3774_005045 [Rhodotorula dairenensis]
MAAPDWPRVPAGYRFDAHAARLATVDARLLASRSASDPRPGAGALAAAVTAATALALAAHAGEDRYAFALPDGRSLRGDVDRASSLGHFLARVGEVDPARLDAAEGIRLTLDVQDEQTGASDPEPQRTPLVLTCAPMERGTDSYALRLTFDEAILPVLEAQWFISHVSTAVRHVLTADPMQAIRTVNLAPAGEADVLRRYASCPDTIHEPEAYPSRVQSLATFFNYAAERYPQDPAVHFIPDPANPKNDVVELSYAQLSHLALYLADQLVADSLRADEDGKATRQHRRGQQVVPVVVDKSPEMVISMLAISLAGYGYLALEPSFPEDRKRGICAELQEQGMLAPMAIVQRTGGEHHRWVGWTIPTTSEVSEDSQIMFAHVLDPRETLAPLLDRVAQDPHADLDSAFPLRQTIEDDGSRVAPNDIAYIIYTSGTTGKPKGIVVEQQNVAAFLRNYRGVFGRARGERVLQFPSYSFDVSVMNIWDTLAHGATVCLTTPASLFSSLAETIIALECTLVDLTPTVGALLFEHDEAQPRDGETVEEAWRRAGFRIKQVNTGGEKVEKGIREKWRARGVRVCIDYGPTETTVGVISNQSIAPSPPAPFSLPIGRPTGTTRIYILPSHDTHDLHPLPLGCIGEICVLGPQVTRGYVRTELNKGVFLELDGSEGIGKKGERLYRTGDLGRWVTAPWEDAGDQEGWIECLGRKDGQVKVNGLRIEVGEIEENLSSRLNPAIARSIVDKVESPALGTALVVFLELSPAFLADHPSEEITPGGEQHFHSAGAVSVHPVTTSSAFTRLVDELKSKIGEKLPSYMVPRHWLAVSRIPTQGMGKADRKTLRGLAERWDWRAAGRQQRLAGSGIGREPEAEEEKHFTLTPHYEAARRAWARVLRLPDDPEGRGIADEDSFMRLGGDSIRFMKLVSVLRNEGYAKIAFQDIVEATTLSACAAVLAESGRSGGPDAANGSNSPYQPFSLIPDEHRRQLFDELAALSLESSRLADVYPTAPPQDALIAPSFDSTRGHYYAQAIYSVQPTVAQLPSEQLQQAVTALVERHETLRGVFVISEVLGRTLSVVLKPRDRDVRERSQLQHVQVQSAAEMDEAITTWLRTDRERFPFRWGQLSLSFALFTAQDGTRKLAWSMHHAMSDGWTLELLTLDLRNLCFELALDPRPPFSAVAAWWLGESSPPPESVEFWRDYLGGAQPLGWPTQEALDGDMLATTGASIRHWTGDLMGLTQRSGITPAIASRIAVLVALHYHARSDDVNVGIVRSGRDIDVADADEVIGPCVSVLPSRIRFDHDPSLLSLVKAEAEADRRARRHQHVTLAQLARFCDLPGRADLFDILVTFQSLAERDPEVEAAAPWPVRQPPERIHMPTNYTLSFEITPELHDGDKLELACFFDERITTQAEVDGVLATVGTVLDYLTTAPCTTVSHLKLGSKIPARRLDDVRQSETNGTSPRPGPAALTDRQMDLVIPLRKEWAVILRLDEEECGTDDSFASLGGDSIGTMRLAVRLSKEGLAIPTQKLAKLPTLRAQAEWLAARLDARET